MTTIGRLSNRGQTAVLVLVSVALVSVVGAAIAKVITNSQDEVQFAAAKQGQLKLKEDLFAALQQSQLCKSVVTANLANILAGGGVGELKIKLPITDKDGKPGLAVGADVDVPAYGVRVERLRITQLARQGALSLTRDLYVAKLAMKTSRLSDKFSYAEVDLGSLYVEVESGALAACYGASDYEVATRSSCTAMGGTYDVGQKTCHFKALFKRVICPLGQYLQSFDADGRPDCKTLPSEYAAVAGSDAGDDQSPSGAQVELLKWTPIGVATNPDTPVCSSANPIGESCTSVGSQCVVKAATAGVLFQCK